VGLIGHQFIHAGLWHLLFNMLYLWVFGNAVCEKLGNWVYAGVFLLTGVWAGSLHILLDGSPAVGASGAINGIIGVYLVLYPVNRVNCFYWFVFRGGAFDISGFWLILFWFAIDAWASFSGAATGVGHWAHVGGFVSGLALGVLILKSGLVKMANYDNPTILDYVGGKRRVKRGTEYERQSFVSAPRRAPAPPVPPPPAKPAAASRNINMDCPHCSQNLDVPQDMIGMAFPCPSCQGGIQLEAE
jgi:membrane associated rhomboid family serine protease